MQIFVPLDPAAATLVIEEVADGIMATFLVTADHTKWF